MTDEHFMKMALAEARKAFDAGEVPVGAVVTVGEQVIARGHNMVERLNDATAHAEMIALTSAFERLGAKYLPEATLFVTVEPCLMCTGALYWGKLARVVWGADDEKNGHRRVTGDTWPFHPKTTITRGVLGEEGALLMKEFFRARR
ncbi:MAG: nucleoside deaminase [Chitinophagia bacterium]|nr:nucleoside deaminase [Chitinophagia bacterium]